MPRRPGRELPSDTDSTGRQVQEQQADLIARGTKMPGVAEAASVYARAADRNVRIVKLRSSIYSNGANG